MFKKTIQSLISVTYFCSHWAVSGIWTVIQNRELKFPNYAVFFLCFTIEASKWRSKLGLRILRGEKVVRLNIVGKMYGIKRDGDEKKSGVRKYDTVFDDE